MRDDTTPKRALRREHKKRVINNIFKRKMGTDYFANHRTQEEIDDTKIRSICEASTGKICSNPACCGNPRRMSGKKNLTIQEKKQDKIKDILADA